MKKRVAAAVLGIMLSVSMGLEVPAAALDSGFESGFTSEQAADVQTEDGAEAVQPSEDTEAPADTAAAGEQQAQESQDKEKIQTAKIQEKVQMVFSMALLQVKQWRRMEVLLL